MSLWTMTRNDPFRKKKQRRYRKEKNDQTKLF